MAADQDTTPPTPTPPTPPLETQSQDLPQVIVLKPPHVFNYFMDIFTEKFHLLKS